PPLRALPSFPTRRSSDLRRIAAIARVRQQKSPVGLVLRRGRQYLRETSFLGRPFAIPDAGELIGWSRILHDQEVLVALNTHGVRSEEHTSELQSRGHLVC